MTFPIISTLLNSMVQFILFYNVKIECQFAFEVEKSKKYHEVVIFASELSISPVSDDHRRIRGETTSYEAKTAIK